MARLNDGSRGYIDHGINDDGFDDTVYDVNGKPLPKKHPIHGDVFVTQNLNGDTMYLNERELTDELRAILEREIKKKGIDLFKVTRNGIREIVKTKVDTMKKETLAYFDRKLQKMTEDLYEKMLSRHIEEEIEKRVEEKLAEMRKVLDK